MKNICVFCASGIGENPVYGDTAYDLGVILAKKGFKIIYGGGKVGLMGKLAEGALSHGGEVIGIIPEFLKTKEVAHENLTELIVTQSMHERKRAMYERADAFIALPGGFGTMDELFESLTWVQLGRHQKPIGILNVNGYYDFLIKQLDKMTEEKLLYDDAKRVLKTDTDAEGLLKKIGI